LEGTYVKKKRGKGEKGDEKLLFDKGREKEGRGNDGEKRGIETERGRVTR